MFFGAVFGLFCALVMGAIFLWRGMPAAAAAAVLWLVYALYELLQFVRLVCNGDCGIGIDLLFVWPLLLLVSVFAFRQSWNPPPDDAEDDL